MIDKYSGHQYFIIEVNFCKWFENGEKSVCEFHVQLRKFDVGCISTCLTQWVFDLHVITCNLNKIHWYHTYFSVLSIFLYNEPKCILQQLTLLVEWVAGSKFYYWTMKYFSQILFPWVFRVLGNVSTLFTNIDDGFDLVTYDILSLGNL